MDLPVTDETEVTEKPGPDFVRHFQNHACVFWGYLISSLRTRDTWNVIYKGHFDSVPQ